MDNKMLFGGKFGLGVNYWASHAAIRMWSDWDANEVEKDLKVISEAGLNVIRVFPLWSDFQPVKPLLGGMGDYKEPSEVSANGDEKLTKEGISEKCIAEFSVLCDLAEKYGLLLIVPLITGFMSGSCFFPEILAGKNIIADPFAVRMQIDFVRYFVKKFRYRKCIKAWELGNECNNLGRIASPDEAWMWTYAITSAVKIEDSERPVISGMHGLCGRDNYKTGWTVTNQAELCDILTVHPYSLFTPNCDTDGLISARAVVHAVAEQTMYGDLGKRECLIEEIGTLGDIYGDGKTVAKFTRANLFGALAYNTLGMLWWTAFDQNNQDYAPYEWVDCERELGIFTCDRKPKEAVEEYGKFAEILSNVGELPERERNLICIAAENDYDGMFGTYMLAKRAGLEPLYTSIDKPLPDGGLYTVAGNGSVRFMRKSVYRDLQKKVADGATVLITYDGGCISDFDDFIGCSSKGRVRDGGFEFEVNNSRLFMSRSFKLLLEPTSAQVVLRDSTGDALFTAGKYGKGNVLFFNAPLERFFDTRARTADGTLPYEYVYSYAKQAAGVITPVSVANPNIYFTLHKTGENKFTVVAVNNTAEAIADRFELNGYKLTRTVAGNIDNNGNIEIDSADGVIFEIEK